MALVQNTDQLKTRHFNDDIHESEEISKLKMRLGVRVVRDYPQGCGIINAKGRIPFNKLKPKRPPGNIKLKFSDTKEADEKKSKEEVEVLVSEKDKTRSQEIEKAMNIFYEVYNELFLANREKEKVEKIAHWRVPGEAVKVVKSRLNWVEVGKSLGPIFGVEIGDKFRYRAQLQMIGVHCQPQSGIDYMEVSGKNVAISIVDSSKYQNDRKSSDVMKYCGQGGVRFLGSKADKLPEDQKLERGNLALKNSMVMKNVVRVIRKISEVKGGHDVFVYDGLYVVKKFEKEKDDKGKMVFMFELERVPGQPQLHELLNKK
ncbi:YDG domain-containing protein At5g47150-like [Rutidosis leptorrhynchoides]|uniref:YDG domain-containing protein At5g47150-like n=1 Tax=Rutidosis leptorrhynchoides TaxID=125765 RepID=UPI003A9986B1